MKTLNLRRNPRASLCVISERFWGAWHTVEGAVEIVELPEAMEPLVEYYRATSAASIPTGTTTARRCSGKAACCCASPSIAAVRPDRGSSTPPHVAGGCSGVAARVLISSPPLIRR